MEKQEINNERREIVNGLEIVRRPWKGTGAWITIYNANRRPENVNPKPIINLAFKSWERAEERIRQEVEARAAWDESKRKRADARREYQHSFKVGDILYSSWGYDQTNIDFYEVVGVNSPKTVTLREIGSRTTDTETGNSMAAFCVPNPGHYAGVRSEPFKKTVCPGNQVKLSSFEYAWPWDGKEKYSSWYA